MKNVIRAPSRIQYSKRRHPRLRVAGPIEVLWHAHEFTCKLRNLSVQGAMLSGQFPVQLKDVVRMLFRPNDMPVEMLLRAQVVHVAGTAISQFGITFLDLPSHAKVILDDYVLGRRPPLPHRH